MDVIPQGERLPVLQRARAALHLYSPAVVRRVIKDRSVIQDWMERDHTHRTGQFDPLV